MPASPGHTPHHLFPPQYNRPCGLQLRLTGRRPNYSTHSQILSLARHGTKPFGCVIVGLSLMRDLPHLSLNSRLGARVRAFKKERFCLAKFVHQIRDFKSLTVSLDHVFIKKGKIATLHRHIFCLFWNGQLTGRDVATSKKASNLLSDRKIFHLH